MTYAQQMMDYFSPAQNMEFLLRILVACACGVMIGYERSLRYKEAGVRTHFIVCCAAAMLMIVSKYGFVDLGATTGGFLSGTSGADPARIAASVISGVGFLGAGAIFRNKNVIRGLTTAAGIWATAGIGLAIGAGMYWVGIFTTVLISFFLLAMHRFTAGSDSFSNNQLEFEVDSDMDFEPVLKEFAASVDGRISDFSISKRAAGITTYSVTLRAKKVVTVELLSAFADRHEGVHTAHMTML